MTLTQNELGAYLWGAATLLRGLVDASDYKQYLFPLLFFKRLSDVWDEDYREAFDETQDENYAAATANDRFTIPDRAHWRDVRAASPNVGRALLNAFQAIEAANAERLQGVFGNAAWTDKAQMPDETLKNLIGHFSKHALNLANVPEDELGNAFVEGDRLKTFGAALAKDGNLSTTRYVRTAAASSPGETRDLATAWSSFEQEGRAFWTEMDSHVEMLDGLVAHGSGDP